MIKKLLLSILIIFALLSFGKSALAQSATLKFSPATGSFAEGESFWLTIQVDTKGVAVNAVAAYFSYPEDKLESLGVNTAGSAMNIFAEKESKSGQVKISGGEPTPGFSGIKKIASVGFKVKVSSGNATLKFSSDSVVLTNAENKNILSLTSSGQGNYSLIKKSALPPAEDNPPFISELQVKEISQTGAVVSWKTDQEADSILEYGLTNEYGFSMSDDKLTKEHSLMVFGLSPGTNYYFKVRSQAKSGKWSETDGSVFSTLGYQVEIKILDEANLKPISGAKVTLSASAGEITRTTNDEGKAVFENFPLDEQWFSVDYQDKSSSYKIKVLPKEEVQSYEVKFKAVQSKEKPFLIFGLASLIIIFVLVKIFFIFLNKKRSNDIPISGI